MMKTISLIVFIIFLIIFGVALVTSPRTIQRIASRAVDQGPTAKSYRLKTFIASTGYLWNVRFIGLLAILMGGFLVFTLMAR